MLNRCRDREIMQLISLQWEGGAQYGADAETKYLGSCNWLVYNGEGGAHATG